MERLKLWLREEDKSITAPRRWPKTTREWAVFWGGYTDALKEVDKHIATLDHAEEEASE